MQRASSVLTSAFLIVIATGALAGPSNQDAATQEQAVPKLADAVKLLAESKFAEAAELLELITAANPNDGAAWYNYGYALHNSGDVERAHDAHARAETFDAYRVSAGYNHACVHAVKDEIDDAFIVLGNCVDAGFSDAELMRTDPELANLRDDPRYTELLARVTKASVAKAAEEPDWTLYTLESIPAEHRFDFTIGDWDLFTEGEGNEPVQRHVVERIFDGSGVQRDIFDPEGELRAKSIFVYAPQTKVWKQFFTDSEGRTAVLRGGLEGDEMIMRQIMRNEEPDASARIVYSRVDTKTFESRFEETTDGGVTWTTTATTRYVARPKSDG